MPEFMSFSRTPLHEPSEEDRRETLRHLSSRICYARPNGKNAGVAWGVQLSDISQTGISVVLRCQLQQGTILSVQPTRNSLSQTLFARVVRVVGHDNGWLHGCEFLRPLDYAELRPWLAD